MTDTAKEAVLRQLAVAHDHWSEEEQLLKAQGRPSAAETAHQFAVRLLRAYIDEKDDKEPEALPDGPVPVVDYWQWLRRGIGR